MAKILGTIFNIQRFSIHDGPGIRTTVFFKGCNLSCKWCHNPESKAFEKQIEFYPKRCIGCGECFKLCPRSAHIIDDNGKHRIDRVKCKGCLLCSESCYAGALAAVGEQVDGEYLFRAIMTDEKYYRNSSGGVTFSGGECMLQIDFLLEVLKKCKNAGIHTAVDTAGGVPWSSFEKILPYTDLFLYDVKTADSERHQVLTGINNELILMNLKKLAASGKQLYVRIPFVVGYNDDQIEKIGEILRPLPIDKVEVIPYHKLGNSKYSALDMVNELSEIKIPEENRIEGAIEILKSKGLKTEKA